VKILQICIFCGPLFRKLNLNNKELIYSIEIKPVGSIKKV